jgi:hypothetical protein
MRRLERFDLLPAAISLMALFEPQFRPGGWRLLLQLCQRSPFLAGPIPVEAMKV